MQEAPNSNRDFEKLCVCIFNEKKSLMQKNNEIMIKIMPNVINASHSNITACINSQQTYALFISIVFNYEKANHKI